MLTTLDTLSVIYVSRCPAYDTQPSARKLLQEGGKEGGKGGGGGI